MQNYHDADACPDAHCDAHSDANADTKTAEALYATLTTLEDSGADHFDPVRFRYLQTMAKRSRQQDTAVAHAVVKKTWEALQGYQSDLFNERAQVKALILEIAEQHPQMTEQLECLFGACEFKVIRRLVKQQEQVENNDTFAALTNRLSAGAHDASGLPANGTQELKAIHHFRDSLQQQHAEKIVAHALTDAPQSAGPLNPQKLALRSLAIMREISPAYLGHFVSYVDTLFWLDKTDNVNAEK